MRKHINIIVYGAHWCPDCRRSKQFLGEHQIPYNWVDIEEDKKAEKYVLNKNDGKRIIPTIEFADGTILVEPSNAELAAKLELKTKAERNHYDLIIVGGGPAGLTAAIYTAREGIDTLVIEKGALGGQSAATQRLDNVPGFSEGIDGGEFADQLYKQAERFGVEVLQAQDVIRVAHADNYRAIFTSDGSKYTACSMLLAPGSRYKRLGVPGEQDYIGAGIHFCATCDGPFYKGEHVAVVGGGNSATEESLFLMRFVDRVTLLVRGDKLSASQILQEKISTKPKINIRYQTDVIEFGGKGGKLKSVRIRNNQTGETEVIHPAGAFIFIGQIPNTGFLDRTGIRTNPWGFIITGHELFHNGARPEGFENRDPTILETSVPGIFAAGDVRAGSTKQVASAAGDGATAALSVREYLKTV
jgi:thioredoxin reductase (NADPH)